MAIELPEAAHIAAQMDKELRGKKITGATVDEKESASKLKWGMINLTSAEFERRLVGKTVLSVYSRGKGIYTELDGDLFFICGTETNGKVLYHRPGADLPDRYNLRLDFDDDSALTVRIIAWGWGVTLTGEELKAHRYLGQEEVSLVDEEEFAFDVFDAYLGKFSNKPIKAILIKQGEALSGIGNGYLQDILFKSGLHPKRKARDIAPEDRRTLYDTIISTLQEATEMGGRDSEFDLYNNPGRFRVILDKRIKGKLCPQCGTAIEKSNILGSTCYVCPVCQI